MASTFAFDTVYNAEYIGPGFARYEELADEMLCSGAVYDICVCETYPYDGGRILWVKVLDMDDPESRLLGYFTVEDLMTDWRF